jgi:hypothetical protein
MTPTDPRGLIFQVKLTESTLQIILRALRLARGVEDLRLHQISGEMTRAELAASIRAYTNAISELADAAPI